MSNIIKPIFKASACKFGNGYIQYIDEFPIKKQVLEYLYSCLKYTDFAVDSNIENVNNTFTVSPYFRGFNYILMATLVNKLPAVLLIEKDELKPELNDVSFNMVKIMKAKTNLPLENFLGTIIDGQTIKEHNSNTLHFIVNDMFYLNGQHIQQSLTDKIKTMDSWISSFTVSQYDPFDFRLPPLYTQTDFTKLIKAMGHLEYPIIGLLFRSHDGNQKYYFVEQNRHTKVNTILNNTTEQQISLPNSTSNDLVQTYYKLMMVVKTNQPDVYTLIDPTNNTKCGFALVQTLDDSHKLCEVFEHKQKQLFKCVFNDKFGKWKPISIVN